MAAVGARASHERRLASGQLREHLLRVLSQVGRRAADLAGVVREVCQHANHLHGAHARVVDLDYVAIVHELRMVHRLDGVQERLAGDVAVFDVNLHPLVHGLFLHALENELPQGLLILRREGGRVLEPVVLQHPAEADGAQVCVQ